MRTPISLPFPYTTLFRSLLRFEIELWAQGFNYIAGVDEAGMAPLAGPVIAAACILPQNYKLRGLNDSKQILDETFRGELADRKSTRLNSSHVAISYAVFC